MPDFMASATDLMSSPGATRTMTMEKAMEPIIGSNTAASVSTPALSRPVLLLMAHCPSSLVSVRSMVSTPPSNSTGCWATISFSSSSMVPSTLSGEVVSVGLDPAQPESRDSAMAAARIAVKTFFMFHFLLKLFRVNRFFQ